MEQLHQCLANVENPTCKAKKTTELIKGISIIDLASLEFERLIVPEEDETTIDDDDDDDESDSYEQMISRPR